MFLVSVKTYGLDKPISTLNPFGLTDWLSIISSSFVYEHEPPTHLIRHM